MGGSDGSPTGLDRQRLIAAMLCSDEAAWRQFIDQYGPLIYSVLRKFPRLRDEWDDAFQEIAVIIHRSLASLRDREKLAVWIYSIAHRHAVELVRRRSRRQVVEGPRSADDPDLVDDQPSAEAALEQLQWIARLLDCVEHLRPRCQRLLRALYLDDPPQSYRQIEEREGIPIGSIGPTRARCLDELRRLWDAADDVSNTD